MVLVLQEVLVDELVAAVDTLPRYAVSGALQRLLGSLPAALASNAVRALGPWRPLLLPLPTPLELLNRSVSCPLLLLGPMCLGLKSIAGHSWLLLSRWHPLQCSS